MTTDEPNAHVQDLWDRIAAHPANVGVSDAWRQELARRSADLKTNAEAVVPWEEVRAELRGRVGKSG